ncbi:hypothetical protein PsorP6_010433 [Peronosclerospora sorghi]|uniref:Uncharacterized protein n=1 Tax=Peronosclerospora sorghi TaxID=230839 RepID=A0ACC0VU27_9STRA|nr:hypothetical protein PsorP6_010433 [Peronosclerospora sorghi]
MNTDNFQKNVTRRKRVIEVFSQCLEKMRKVYLAPDDQPLVVAGSGTLGWDMVGANLISEGDDVLFINTGYFGDILGGFLERYDAQTTLTFVER